MAGRDASGHLCDAMILTLVWYALIAVGLVGLFLTLESILYLASRALEWLAPPTERR